MTLPNAITLLRGLAGLAVAALLLEGWRLVAFWTFIAAVSTDLFDGWLARKLNQVSPAAQWLDPFCDKALVAATWVGLVLAGYTPLWLPGALLLRDVLVVLAWLVARYRGVVFRPTLSGRLMISYEGVTLPFLLLHGHWAGVHWMSAGVALGTLTLWLSLWSAGEYAAQWRAASRRGQ